MLRYLAGLRRVLLLLLAAGATAAATAFAARQDVLDWHEPLHKGAIDLSTGLYIREDEDLVLRGAPPLILRRTYVSGWHESAEFGVGATHNGERYLVGDGERFQWASLILENGSRIRFERISKGSSFLDGLFEHSATPSEYQGARLGWTALGWAMRLRDGSVTLFQSCGPKGPELCSVIETRDPANQTVRYKRESSGRLLRIEASPDRWIAFDYDSGKRITRAYDSAEREVRYAYDERGRLSRVTTFDGKTREYTYTDRDEMRTIVDPHIRIENTYDADGRCIRQVNWFPDEPDPYTFEFAYRGSGRAIVQTDVNRSDGTWTKYTFSERRYPTSETWGRSGHGPASFTYERDPATSLITAMTITCPDRTGRPVRHSSLVAPGQEDWVRRDLLQTHCSWSNGGAGSEGQRRTARGIGVQPR